MAIASGRDDDRSGPPEAHRAASVRAMDHWRGAPTACSAAEAVADISSGERVFIGSGAAEPVSLVSAMTERAPELRDVSVLHIYTIGPAPYAEPGYEASFRHISFFVGANVREAVLEGRADTVPIHLHEVPRMFEQHHRLDWALVQLSRPDRHGYCTVGVSADVVVAAMRNARRVVAELNPQMPRTHGNNQIHISELHAVVDVDAPLPEVVPPEVDDTVRRIGENVASLVRDGDCLQAGIGSVPNAALAALKASHMAPSATESVAEVFRRFGADEWDALRTRFNAGAAMGR